MRKSKGFIIKKTNPICSWLKTRPPRLAEFLVSNGEKGNYNILIYIVFSGLLALLISIGVYHWIFNQINLDIVFYERLEQSKKTPELNESPDEPSKLLTPTRCIKNSSGFGDLKLNALVLLPWGVINKNSNSLTISLTYGEGSEELSQPQYKYISSILKLFDSCQSQRNGIPRLSITGYASGSGSKEDNLDLANRRALNIRTLLQDLSRESGIDLKLPEIYTWEKSNIEEEYQAMEMQAGFRDVFGQEYSVESGKFNRRVDLKLVSIDTSFCDFSYVGLDPVEDQDLSDVTPPKL